jgi:N-acyl-D-glutamate deacylase
MLERSTSAARHKSKLQEGADADIVVFDAATVSDRATFEKPMQPSVGVRYLLVAGTVVVNEERSFPMFFRAAPCWGTQRCMTS